VAKSSTLAFRPPAVMRQESSCATARVLVPSVSFAGVPSVRSGGVATPLVILSHVAIPGFEGRFVGVNGSAISGFVTASMSPSASEPGFRWAVRQPAA
jgi:hypothetical protein